MKFANHMRFMNKVRHKLLAAGLEGISQNDLHQQVRTRVFQGDDLMEILYEWESRGWVQSFRVKGLSRHPKMMWRATTLLRDKYNDVSTEFVEAATVGSGL